MSVRRICRAIVTTLVAVVGALLMSQPAWAIDTGFTYEMNPQHNNGKCVEVQGASTASGAHLVQTDCANRPSQRFRFESLGSGVYKIRPVHASNRCLAVENDSRLNGGHIIQKTCANDLNQQFRILNDKLQAGISGAQIQAASSSRCLDVPGFSNALIGIQQFACNTGANQKFDLVAS